MVTYYTAKTQRKGLSLIGHQTLSNNNNKHNNDDIPYSKDTRERDYFDKPPNIELLYNNGDI